MVVCLALQGAELHISGERTAVMEEGEAVKNYVFVHSNMVVFPFCSP